MLTFKQFLMEGGKATEKYGTVRADSSDIRSVISKVAEISGIDASVLKDRLLGSGRLTYNGKQQDSGDIDLAIQADEVDTDELVKKLEKFTGHPGRPIGGNTFSFAFPVGEKKVQLDIMVVPDIKWAKFSHHASEFSKHKSGVRNELIHSTLKFTLVPGQDVRVRDDLGNDIARASRSYKLIDGVERIFKIAPKRKDGKGRTLTPQKASPDEVAAVLKDIGHDGKFSKERDLVRDPDKFAQMLFGDGVKASQMMSTEQMIELIKKHRKADADKIFKDAVKGMKRLKFPIPSELKSYE